AGRKGQIFRMIDTIAERGRHAVLFGERGVGKTSLVQIMPYLVPATPKTVRYIRVQAYPKDTFHSIANRVFKRIKVTAESDEGGLQEYDASQIFSGVVTPDDFLRECQNFSLNDIPIIVIDEFNEVN